MSEQPKPVFDLESVPSRERPELPDGAYVVQRHERLPPDLEAFILRVRRLMEALELEEMLSNAVYPGDRSAPVSFFLKNMGPLWNVLAVMPRMIMPCYTVHHPGRGEVFTCITGFVSGAHRELTFEKFEGEWKMRT
jgi:hypothetical protein